MDKLKKRWIFGIYKTNEAAVHTALGLHSLQHRGQEGAGIVSFDGNKFYSIKKEGLVGDNFNDINTFHSSWTKSLDMSGIQLLEVKVRKFTTIILI